MPMMLAWNFLKANATGDWINPQIEYPTEPGQTNLGQFDWRGMFHNQGPYISPSQEPEKYQARQDELAQQHAEGMQPMLSHDEHSFNNWADKINDLSTKHKDKLDSHGYPATSAHADEMANATNKWFNGDEGYRDFEMEKLQSLLQEREFQNFPNDKPAVQTKLGNFLGFPSQNIDPINMIRIENQRKRGQNKLYQAMSEGMEPYHQNTGREGGQDYQGFEGQTGRPFPLREKPGRFTTAANLWDIGNIATGESIGQNPLIWGMRESPQNIDAFMRNPDEAPENLNEVFIRDKIKPDKLTRFPDFADSKKHGGVWSRLGGATGYNVSGIDLRNGLMHYAKHEIPPLKAGLDSEGQPITFDLDNAGLTEEERKYIDIERWDHNDPMLDMKLKEPNRLDIFEEVMGELDGHIKDKLFASLEKDGHHKDDIKEWRMGGINGKVARAVHDWAVKTKLPKYSTSDVNFPTNEHHWPIHPNGSPFTIHELTSHRKSIKEANNYLHNLHMNRRALEFGEMGQEFTTQPPSDIERRRWDGKGILTDSESNMFRRGGGGKGYGEPNEGLNYGKYSPELWDKIREIRESERNESI